MTKRKVPGSNWIKGWMFWMQEAEAPDSYLTWAAVSAMAGASRRQIFCKWGYHRYYANHYVILVGPAGIVHKSSTIDMVRGILREIGIPTASESQSREELIGQMISRGDGITSALTALPDELSDFIRVSGHTMIEFLTTIYSCPGQWEYSTKKRGTEIINNAFLNLLGGTTPRWIANEFDATFVEGGFASRTLFVHETEPRFRKARMIITPEMQKMYDLLVEDLLHISQLKGEFEWDPLAMDWFDNWYNTDIEKELKAVDYRLKTYIARKPTHVLKLAMILQINITDELILTRDNIKDAKHMLDNLEMSMARTFSAVGRNLYSSDLERMAAEIKEAGGMTYTEIVRRNYSAMGRQIMEDNIQTLVDAEMVNRVLSSDGTITFYPIKEDGQS